MQLSADLINELIKTKTCDIRTDQATRVLYSTDASIYQIEPLGVVLPWSQEGLHAVLELSAKYRVPVLARGSGTSLAGQAVNEALIIDCSRWLDRIVAIDPDAQTATVEPGVLLSDLNRNAARYGLQFGPDPASVDRATLGGVIANNATGAHSIIYGMAADHILGAEVIFSDGTLGRLAEIADSNPHQSSHAHINRLDRFVAAIFEIRNKYAQQIKEKYPGTWRNSAGYRINYVLPWSPSLPPLWGGETYPPAKPGTINLASLLAGSEGTLAVIRELTLNLVKKLDQTILCILNYDGLAEACDSIPRLLEHQPSAIELIPHMLVRLARTIPAYRHLLDWVRGDPAAILVVEFSGDRLENLIDRAKRLSSDAIIIEKKEDQAKVWNVRKVGLGILDARPQSSRPIAFIEDCAIPVEKLGEFVRAIQAILQDYHAEAGIYAHASAGCLHIRPVLDLKTDQGRHALRSIAERVLSLTIQLGGAMSSEHGDGILRGEWLSRTYGDELVNAMRALKSSVDPEGLLNPNKMFDAPPMDTLLRYGREYQSGGWVTPLDFSGNGGLTVAIEQCNGQGVCRKFEGVMCPSFQATRDEMHSTRGRANLLRALISQPVKSKSSRYLENNRFTEDVANALDLCLGCKGCRAECPSGVDVAKLKIAFSAEYFKNHPRPLRDYLFGYFHITAGLLSAIPSVSNFIIQNKSLMAISARMTGISSQRSLPFLHHEKARPSGKGSGKQVLYLSDPYTHYLEPDVEQAAFDVLTAMGLTIQVLPISGAGASLLSKGFIHQARRHAGRLLELAQRLDPENKMPIISLEPPEVYTLKHDYFDLLPKESEFIRGRVRNAFLMEEFLVRSQEFADLRIAINPKQITMLKQNRKIIFHPHCHQQAERMSMDQNPVGVNATLHILRSLGYDLELSGAGCCGMGGSFGFDTEHYDLSMKIGELKLLPEIRRIKISEPEAIVTSTGSACRLQIEHGTGFKALHPIVMIRERMLEAANFS